MTSALRSHDFGGTTPRMPAERRGGSRLPADAGKRLQPAPLAGPAGDPHGLNRYQARAASSGMVRQIKEAMKEDLRRLGGGATSRTLAAERLSELLDRPISETALNGLVAPSHEDRRLAASDVPGWCETVGSYSVLHVIAKACGVTVVDSRVAEAGMLLMDLIGRLEDLEDLGERVLTELIDGRAAVNGSAELEVG